MWLGKKKRISEETLKDYINAINRHLITGITEPKQIPMRGKVFAKALRNFLNFLESEYYMDELNGFSLSLWRKHIPIRSMSKRGEKIFVTDKDIKEALSLIKEKWNDHATITLFKLLVFSGIRLEHGWRLLKSFDKRKLLVEDRIAMYPIEGIAKGKKKGYFAIAIAESLKDCDHTLSHRTFYVRFMVGHSPMSVGEAHYYNMLKIAEEDYKKIVDKSEG